MARIGITYEEVKSHAETLIAKGENPTLEKIRRALGDRGSNSTISKYLNQWRGTRAQFANKPQVALIPDPVNEAVGRVWYQLREETQTEINQIKEEARASIEVATQQKEQALFERNQAFQELEELKTTMSELKNKNANLESSLNQAQKALEITEGRLKEIEIKHAEFKSEKEKQVSELMASREASISQLKEQMHYLNQEHKKEIETYKTLMEEQRHAETIKKEALKAENLTLEKKLRKIEGTELQSQTLIGELSLQLKSRDFQLEETKNESKKYAAKLQIAQRHAAALEAEINGLNTLAMTRQEKYDAYRKELILARETIVKLEERLSQFGLVQKLLNSNSSILAKETQEEGIA